MSSDEKEKKDYKAMIIARAEKSKELRQSAIEKMETPKDKSLRQKAELAEEEKKED